MAAIKTEFSDHFPLEGAEKHRDTTKRRLFTQCVCQAENEGVADVFTVRRKVTETSETKSAKHDSGKFKGQHELIRMTLTAVFTS